MRPAVLVMSDDAELARLITLVAHELRTPLSVISGYMRMLAGERQGPLTEAQRRSVEGAERACRQLIALAADVSWLARIARGEISPSRSPLSLARLLDEVARAHTPLDEHPVSVEAAHASSGASDLTITADAAHLQRALTSMLVAVVRAAPEQTIVRIVGSRRDGGAQTGVAIAPAAVIDELLDADVNTLEPLNESAGGLGIGLPLARRLVALEGGAIRARTTPQGLGLLLTLPSASADVTPA